MRGSIADDRGAVTVEAAIAIAALVVFMVLCLAAVMATVNQVRCVDAAREAARLAARGDTAHAESAARLIAPAGARIDLQSESGFVTARIRVGAVLLPGLELTAAAVAALEDGATDTDGEPR